MSAGTRRFLACIAAIACTAASAEAQQATVTTPFHSTNSSFFEQIGTQWGVTGPNFFFQFGGGGMAQPPFGNADPAAGIRSGWSWNSGPWRADFNFIAGQGSRSGMVSQAPSITLPQGGTGYFSDTSQSPFVISYIPVVGGAPQIPFGYPMAPPAGFGFPYPGVGAVHAEGNPRVQAMLRERAAGGQAVEAAPGRNPPPAPEPAEPERAPAAAPPVRASTAAVAAPGVAEARLMHQQEQAAANQEAMQLLERGITAEESGKPGVARIYYRMAFDRAQGDVREQVQTRLNGLTP